ncbi:hypothetical protein Syun_009866 [Stephania yunnanensis]|uniref:Uncharacterized protein n=1 Tax=Stephania yunnanensis TaxID=152371 RepID=A0AAP0KFF6_9MAGN
MDWIPMLFINLRSWNITHGDFTRSECNLYCLDCKWDAFCFYCWSSRHMDHGVIQIRRSSYHDAVRVAEIQKVLDIGGV